MLVVNATKTASTTSPESSSARCVNCNRWRGNKTRSPADIGEVELVLVSLDEMNLGWG